MRIKTESGVSISFVTQGSSKVLVFDRPVRAVELKKEEIAQINALLASRFEVTGSHESERPFRPVASSRSRKTNCGGKSFGEKPRGQSS